MISLKKIPSLESYDVDGSTLRQVIHFEFDAGFYDLNSSCVELTTSIVPVEGGADPTQVGIHNVALSYPPVVFIKSAQISSDKAGILEDLSNVNFRELNMRKFTRSTAQNESQSYIDGQTQVDEFSNNYSNFRTLYRSGTTKSVVNKPVLRIPLNEICGGIGSMVQYPPNLGKTRLRLEFQSGSMMMNESVKFTDHSDAAERLDCDDIDAAASREITSVVLEDTYLSDNSIPIWVGEKLNIQYTHDSATSAEDVLITGISRASGTVTVTFTPELVTTDLALTNISIIEIEVDSLAYKIESPQLLLFQITPSPSQAASAVKKLRNASIPFRTYSLEMDNLTETAEYNRQFYLEPNTNSAMMFFRPPATASGEVMDSSSSKLHSWRTALGQVDLTNTDVVKNSPLAKDRVMWSILNSNLPLRKLTDPPDVVCNPIPAVSDQQQYSVQLKKESASDDIESCVVHLYKQVNRVLKISQQQVQVN